MTTVDSTSDERTVNNVLRHQYGVLTDAEKQTMQTVHSTSDARTINNVMRHAYRVLSDDEKAQMQAIKDKGLELWNLIGSVGESRELSLAKTKADDKSRASYEVG